MGLRRQLDIFFFFLFSREGLWDAINEFTHTCMLSLLLSSLQLFLELFEPELLLFYFLNERLKSLLCLLGPRSIFLTKSHPVRFNGQRCVDLRFTIIDLEIPLECLLLFGFRNLFLYLEAASDLRLDMIVYVPVALPYALLHVCLVLD